MSAIQQGGQQRGFRSGRRPAWFKFMLLAVFLAAIDVSTGAASLLK
jgi:hypothetical protein